MVYAESEKWDYKSFIKSFEKSECYMPPLKLEEAEGNTFLETDFTLQRNEFRYKLKNVNKSGKEYKIWRYHHFQSGLAFEQKKTILISCMKKVHKQSSDDEMILESANDKLEEFARLGYPKSLLKLVCGYLYTCTHNTVWLIIGKMM